MIEKDSRWQKVHSRDGQAARNTLVAVARQNEWDLKIAGSKVPHIQFRSEPSERPYSFSLNLNPVTPTFYVRKPSEWSAQEILSSFEGAHKTPAGEIKIPVSSQQIAEKVARKFF